MSPVVLLLTAAAIVALVAKFEGRAEGPCSYFAVRVEDGQRVKLGGAGANFTLEAAIANEASMRAHFLDVIPTLGAGTWQLFRRCDGQPDKLIAG